jgi:ATP-dependent DNA helicase PIF1
MDLSKGKNIKKLPIKHLQSINLSFLLPLKLKLKVNVPIILLRNLCPKKGLCNRSCIVIISLRNYCIKGRLLREDFNKQLQTISQIKLFLGKKDLTFTLTYKQFLVCLCFVITINKSQEQSFKQVKMDLRTSVFFYN